MNITNQEQCVNEWERQLILTADDSHVPLDERRRVLQEIDMLYSEMHDLLSLASGNSDS